MRCASEGSSFSSVGCWCITQKWGFARTGQALYEAKSALVLHEKRTGAGNLLLCAQQRDEAGCCWYAHLAWLTVLSAGAKASTFLMGTCLQMTAACGDAPLIWRSLADLHWAWCLPLPTITGTPTPTGPGWVLPSAAWMAPPWPQLTEPSAMCLAQRLQKQKQPACPSSHLVVLPSAIDCNVSLIKNVMASG